jgi:intracellular sulfur oxidation DsrE/DsrF family protein
MNKEHELDLNAFVDNELTVDQQAEFLEAMRADPELAREVCQAGQLKASLRLAYADPPAPRATTTVRHRGAWQAFAAGLMMLAVGLIGGWLLHDGATSPGVTADRFVLLDAQGRGQSPAAAADGETRIVFHLTSGDPATAGELLDEVEGMLLAFRTDGRPLRVEVVSHSDGLALLRKSLTRHSQRIGEMAQAYSNLTFVACKNTIDRLKVENGIEVQLLPNAEIIDSGVSHVVNRQRQGWSYIRV